MATYIQKPITVTAVQWDGVVATIDAITLLVKAAYPSDTPNIVATWTNGAFSTMKILTANVQLTAEITDYICVVNGQLATMPKLPFENQYNPA